MTAVDMSESLPTTTVVPPQPQLPTAKAVIPVLHVINGEHYAGAERVQDLLAQCLLAQGFEAAFACLKPGRFAAVRCSQSPLYELGMRGRFDLRPAFEIARLVDRAGYRLLHAHTPRTAMICCLAARRCGVPWVYHVHSPTARDSTRRWQNLLNRLIERWSVRSARRLIAVSKSLRQQMERAGVDPRRLVVVHNGVPRMQPAPFRALPCGTWTLGTVALFRPRKGTEVLLEALALLRRQGFQVRLRAVGPFETPQYEAHLKGLCRRLDLDPVVEWAGFSDQVPAELARMDLFVLPSLFGEGLPMVVLEAMATGTPVVATQVEGIPEAISDGRDGLLVPPGDAGELAATIARVLDGRVDWRQLRAHALGRQAQEFSDQSMAAGVARVYREMLGMGEGLGIRD